MMVVTRVADRFPYGRFLLIFLLPQLIFAAMALWPDPSDLVDLFNAAVLAVALGVCVAYVPASLAFYFKAMTPGGSAWLGLGISVTSLARIAGTAFLIYFRFARPSFDLVNNYAWAYITYMYLSGGMCHFVAPRAINAVIPTRRWLMAGAIVGFSMFVMFLLSRMFGLQVG